MKIAITAIFRSKDECSAKVNQLIQKLAHQSLQEAACLRYELHETNDDKGIFILWEEWRDNKGLAFHNQQPYLQDFKEKIDAYLESPAEVFLHRK